MGTVMGGCWSFLKAGAKAAGLVSCLRVSDLLVILLLLLMLLMLLVLLLLHLLRGDDDEDDDDDDDDEDDDDNQGCSAGFTARGCPLARSVSRCYRLL